MKKETDTLMQPYVVNIENTTNDKIKNITIFFSYSSLNEKFNTDGNLEQNGLIISSSKDVSYKKLLEHFYWNVIRFGLTKITSETENNNRNYIKYKYYGTNGLFFSRRLIFSSKNYLINSEHIQQPFVVDGSVALILNSIEPNSKLTLRFYPKDMEKCDDSATIQNTIDKLINREV
jgi:hypothetical protein